MTHDVARALIEKQFDEGVIAPLSMQALRAHLRGCEACKAVYDAHAQVEQALDGGANQAARFVARGRPRVESVRRPERRFVWVAAATVAAAAALVFFIMRPDIEPLIARGGPGDVEPTIQIFRQATTEKPQRARAAIRAGDGLLFAYTNPKRSAARYLAIVGRDASGQIRWYHPQWLDATTQPKTIAIKPGVADAELPDAVRHPLPTGPIEICGVFAAKPRPVPQMDAELTLRWPPEGHCATLQVTP